MWFALPNVTVALARANILMPVLTQRWHFSTINQTNAHLQKIRRLRCIQFHEVMGWCKIATDQHYKHIFSNYIPYTTYKINNLTYYIYHAQLSNSLRIKFLGDIFKSHANECFDNFAEDLQVMIKDLDRM